MYDFCGLRWRNGDHTDMKKHKILKWILVVVLIVLGFTAGGVYVMMRMVMKSIGAGNGSVADYDKRVEIWDQPAGNRSRSKLDDMNIKSKIVRAPMIRVWTMKKVVGERSGTVMWKN